MVMMRVVVSVATVLLCSACGGNDMGGGQCSYSTAIMVMMRVVVSVATVLTAVFGLWW